MPDDSKPGDGRVRSSYTGVINDAYDGPRQSVTAEFENAGVAILLPGYSDIYTLPEYDSPVVLVEYRDGVPFVVVWADINQEEPTHQISLAGAAKSAAKPE